MSRAAEQDVIHDPETEGAPGSPPAPHPSPAEGSERAWPDWVQVIPPEEWDVYRSAIEVLRSAGIPFLLGGAFGLATYTGRWRNTKDIDFFILPLDRERAVHTLHSIGFIDFYPTLAYDRGWIYRATRDGVIVDLIWSTPNRRTSVDAEWFKHAGQVQLRTEHLDVIPPEELIWIKLYVLQRDRCDWPDVMNLLYARSQVLDWNRLLARLEEDVPLLHGALSVFAWLCPDKVGDIPARVRRRAGIRKPRRKPAHVDEARVNLLDSRPWFAAFQPRDQPMRL